MALRCAGEDGGAHDPPLEPLTPEDAMKRLPQYLAMAASGGRNASAMYAADAARLRDVGTATAMRLNPNYLRYLGLSEVDVIAQRRGIGARDPSDVERAVRKRLQAGKKLLVQNVLAEPRQ